MHVHAGLVLMCSDARNVQWWLEMWSRWCNRTFIFFHERLFCAV